MWSAGLDEAQAGIKIPGRNVNNLRYADDMTLMAESKEELKRLLMKVKEEREKVGLKLNIQKTKIMASGPITLWKIDRETIETVRDFVFLGSKITADGDCSHEIKRRLLLGRKSMTNLECVLKSRDITLPKKFCLFKDMVSPVVMYGCESWTEWIQLSNSMPKNWYFWTIVLEKALESPLDCKEIQPVHPKGNQSWIFLGKTDAEAETPIFRPPDAKNQLIGKDLDAGKDWRQEEKGMTEDEMVGWNHQCNGHEFEQALGVGAVHAVSKSRIQLSDWTELNWFLYIELSIEPHVLPLDPGARSILLKYMICLREERHDRHCVPSTDLWLLPNCWTNWILI